MASGMPEPGHCRKGRQIRGLWPGRQLRRLSKMLDSIIEDLAGSAAIPAVQHNEIDANPKGQQECDDPKHSP